MRTETCNKKRLMAAFILAIAVCAPKQALAQAAGPGAENNCRGGARSAIVIEDAVNAAAPFIELARRAQLAPASHALQAALAQNACLELLDNDPLFWTLPGAAQPEVILRVRIRELAVAERSLGDKAGNAVGRYIGSYLGGHTEDVPLLKQVGVAVDVLCSKARRKVTTLSGQSAEGQVTTPDQNAQLLQSAAQAAVQEINAFLAANAQACRPAAGSATTESVTAKGRPD